MARCDVCAKSVDYGSGFLLDPRQVIASDKYIDFYFDYHKDDPWVKTITRGWVRQTMTESPDPWLVCLSCISMFKCDTELAHKRVEQWWEKHPIGPTAWKLWEQRREIPEEIQKKKLEYLLQQLPIVDENVVLKKWEKVDTRQKIEGITDIGDGFGKISHPISHLVKIRGTAGVIWHASVAGNNRSFSELVEHAKLQKVGGIMSIFALQRWSQGESIDDLSFELLGVPGWGTCTFLACRIDEDTFLCYWTEGTATEKSTIRV